MMRNLPPIVLFWVLLWGHASLNAQTEVITKFGVNYDRRQKSEVTKSVDKYLARYVGKPSSKSNLIAAESFLESLYFVTQAACSYAREPNATKLHCTIKSKLTLREISITHLPAALLENELKRKLPIQIGQAVDYDKSFSDQLTVVKARVDTFLRKNGYYGAQVVVSERADKNSLFVDVFVDIKDGFFARVNSVVVDGDSPINPRAIRNLYRRMCFSFNRVIESMSIGTLSCYSRELERETTQGLQERLAKLGYIQARIRISHHWIDPSSPDARGDCRDTSQQSSAPRCVDLRIDIEKGPRVRWEVTVKDGVAISQNAVERFVSTMFSFAPLSRASLSAESDELAQDHWIIEEELLDRVTFISAKNVDEQEMTDSANQLTQFLVSKGYANAEVIPSFIQEDEENILIHFEIFPGKPHFLNKLTIMPEGYSRYFTEEELENLIAPRSFTDNGHVSSDKVDDARTVIMNRLKARGFTKVAVKADLSSSNNGAVDAVFYVTSDERQLVDEVIILNGHRDVNEEVLPLLANCDNYMPARRRDQQRKLCNKSSFVPDKLEADAARLADFYVNNAFFYTKVKTEVVDEKTGKRVIFKLYDSREEEAALKPLRRQEIKDILVSGNNSTNTNAIKRLFPITRKSTVLDPIALKKGLAKMRELGRFSRIDHTIMQGQENSDDLYFFVQVAERPSLSVDTSIAFSTDQLLMLEAEVEETNLFSSMLRLNTALGLGLFWGRQSFFSNKLVWPFVLGRPLRFTLTAPSITYDDFMHRPTPSRRLKSKVAFAFEWRITNMLTPYLRYELILTQERERVVLPTFSEKLRALDGLIPTLQTPGDFRGVLKPGISFINLDNPFDPRRGIDLNLWTELSGGPLIGDPPFINVGTQNRFYFPIGPFTIAMQASFMRAFVTPNEDNWKIIKNNSSMDALGGDRSVRGYNDGYIGINSIDGSTTEYSGYLANTANIEVRFPLTTKSAIGNFSGAVFVDQGLLIPCASFLRCTDLSLNETTFRKGFGLSVGAALRYSLPVGPVSLDYGISPITGSGRVHLLFGYAF